MKKNTKIKAEKIAFNFIKKAVRNPFVSVIIAAGGNSTRMGDINKLFAEISGVPVLAITISAFNSSKYIDEIIVVANENDIVAAARLCETYSFTKVKKIIKGGDTRLLSVYNGVSEVSDNAEIVAIHDGARPFIADGIIKAAVDAAGQYGAAAPAVPVKDTIKKAADGFVSETPDRSRLFAIQTPQVFDAGLIKAALYNAVEKKLEVTDDCSAVEAIGGKVKLVEGSNDNIKITTPEDLVIGEAIFNMEDK